MRFLVRLLGWIQGCRRIAWFGISRVRAEAFRLRIPPPSPGKPTLWFHASSQGELEMLLPLIEDALLRGLPVGVSAFSESALPGLRSLRGRTVYSGLSPAEDLWAVWFQHFSVRKLILAKYDFWPGLLGAAAARGAPVLVVNAEWRASLRWILRVFRALREPLPLFKFLVNPGEDASFHALSECLGESSVGLSMNPRFERVRRRLERNGRGGGEPRALFWRERIAELPRPILLLGSAWEPDVRYCLREWKDLPGSLVVVPHVLGGNEVLREFLAKELPGRHLWIEEMGILVDLYGSCDRAFVGGGFSRGIHSTLEPAMSGIPVACGPKRAERFPEVRELRALGVLRVCSSAGDLRHWLLETDPGRLPPEELEKLTAGYQALLEQCL